jgi:hypothetical protein
MGRDSDNFSMPDNFACCGEGHIVLTHMDTVGINRPRNIHTIINDEQTPVLLTNLSYFFGKR